MREIKFKGKCIETGEWVYGFYLKTGPFYHDLQKHVIAIPGKVCDYAGLKFVEVIPETIGQFTGRHDKNGREIYEGDVLNILGQRSHYMNDPDTNKRILMWDEDFAQFNLYQIDLKKQSCGFTLCENNSDCFEIIGNIHENPELLNPTKEGL